MQKKVKEENKTFEGHDLKKASRKELIEILYEVKKREVQLQKELDEANTKLNDRIIRMKSAGNIAEASLSLNDVFAVAQKSADEYLNSIKLAQMESRNALQHAKSQANDIVEEAKTHANALLEQTDRQCKAKLAENELQMAKELTEARKKKNETEKQCDEMIRSTNVEINRKWDEFNAKVSEVLKANTSLNNFLIDDSSDE